VSLRAANPQQRLSAALEATPGTPRCGKRFGAREVLKNISLNIASGESSLARRKRFRQDHFLRLVAGFRTTQRRRILDECRGWTPSTLQTPREHRVPALTRYSAFKRARARRLGLRSQETSETEIGGRVDEALRSGEDAGIRGFAFRPS